MHKAATPGKTFGAAFFAPNLSSTTRLCTVGYVLAWAFPPDPRLSTTVPFWGQMNPH